MTEIDRVITDESAKPFVIRDVILMDFTVGNIKPTKESLQVANPVPLYDDSFKRVGCADIYFSNGLGELFSNTNVLAANLFIDYASPVRLDIETQNVKVYAKPIGILVPMAPQFIVLDRFSQFDEMPVLNLSIKGVYLTIIPPADYNIPYLTKT